MVRLDAYYTFPSLDDCLQNSSYTSDVLYALRPLDTNCKCKKPAQGLYGTVAEHLDSGAAFWLCEVLQNVKLIVYFIL